MNTWGPILLLTNTLSFSHVHQDFIPKFSRPLNYLVKDETGGTFSRHWIMKNIYYILVGKSEGQKPLQKSRGISEDNIQMKLEEGTRSSGGFL